MTTSTYTAVCWREGRTWTVRIPRLGRSAPATRLSQVVGVARGLVATYSQDDPATARIAVDLRLPESLQEVLEAAEAARESADQVSVEAVTLRRSLARRLAAEHLPVRDVASLLGVSYGRALQLVGDRPAAWTGDATGPQASVPHEPVTAAHRPHSSYRHEAYFYRGDDDFVRGTVPFVREGVRLGQPVMVAVVGHRLRLLRDALAADAQHVHLVDMTRLGANPARIIPGWREFIAEHGGPRQPVRGVGEPVWAGRRPAEVAECQLHEGLLNLAVDPDTPMWLRCPYDVEALDASVVEEAHRSHPAVVEAEDYRGSVAYGGAYHVDTLFRSPLPPSGSRPAGLAFGPGDLVAVRTRVAAQAIDAGVDPCGADDLALGVGEIATNSIRHGGGRGWLRTWTEPGALICEVTDRGHIDDPLVGRLAPSTDAEGGRGVWMANQLCDLVQIRSSPQGTTVRIHTWLPAHAAGARPRHGSAAARG